MSSNLLENEVVIVKSKSKAKRASPRKKDPHAIGTFISMAPLAMQELTVQFDEHKNLNERAKIRARMKAILDFISVDTSYPSVGTGEDKKQNPFAYAGDGDTGQPTMGGVRPIAGSENLI